MNKVYDTENEAADAVAEVMRTVTRHSGRWMVAIWQANEDGSITMGDRSTWRFPTAGFLPAVQQLVDSCVNDKGNSPKVDGTVDRPTPLPLAKPFGVVTEDEPVSISISMKQVADCLEPASKEVVEGLYAQQPQEDTLNGN